MTAAKELTTKELATELSTDSRTLRKYLRSITPRDEQPGKGSRWVLPGTKTAISKHRKDFAAWQEAQAKAAAERAAKVAAELTAKVEDSDEDLIDEVEDLLEDEGPSDEDLDAIDED